MTNGKFLITRTDKAGDVVSALPAVKRLKEVYPQSKIIFLCREYTKKILEHNPQIDKIMIYEPQGRHKGFGGLRMLAKELHAENIDTAAAFFPELPVVFALFLAGIRLRIGTGMRWYSFLFNKRIYSHRSKAEKHEAEYNMELLETLNIPAGADLTAKIWTTDSEKAYAEEFMKVNGLTDGKPVIAVHAGGGASVLNWSQERYIEFINMLMENCGVNIVLVEGKEEESLTKDILARLKKRPAVLPGTADIIQLSAVFSRLNLLVSSSTGTSHIAAASGIPTLTLFCPIRVLSPVRWKPLGLRSEVIMPAHSSCRKCLRERCKDYNCMDTISPLAAVQAALNIIGYDKKGGK